MRQLILIILVFLNFSCQSDPKEESNDEQEFGSTTVDSDKILPGSYCYYHRDDIQVQFVKLDVAENASVSGLLQGTKVNEGADQYSSYRSFFEGDIRDDNLQVSLITIEGKDTLREEKTWIIDEHTLNNKDLKLELKNCTDQFDMRPLSTL